MQVSLTGNDIISLNGRIFSDFGDGDIGNIEFPNDLVGVKAGKNGNTIFSLNASGRISNVTLRVLRGSLDDKFLNSQLNQYLLDPPSYICMWGEFVKRVGMGTGVFNIDVYTMTSGVIQKMPGVKENVEGDTEQAVTIWQIVFANNTRIV